MDKHCSNHPHSEAHWYCKKCQVSYCFPCVEKKDFKFTRQGALVHICPECKRMVQWTGIQHISENVLVSTVKDLFFPLAPNALIVITTLYLSGLLFTNNIYLNELLFIAIWTVTGSYAVTVLDHTVQGKKHTPSFTSVSEQNLPQHVLSVFKQSAFILGAAALFAGAYQTNNKPLAYMIMAVSSFIFPLGLMRSIVSKSFRSFFDVSTLAAVLKKTWLQYAAAMVLFLPVFAFFNLLSTIQPALAVASVCYSMITIYRLLGQMILKCHTELNISLNYENFKDRYSLETFHGFKV